MAYKSLILNGIICFAETITFAQFCDIAEIENGKKHLSVLEAFKRLDSEAAGTLTCGQLKNIMMTVNIPINLCSI